MNFELEKADKFAKLLKLVTVLHEEGNFIFDKEQVTLMQTDLAKVSMVKISIAKPFFNTYENAEKEERRFDVSTLSKWVGAEKSLVAEEKENFFRFKEKKKRGRRLRIPNVEGFEYLPELPPYALEHEVVFQAPLSTIKEALSDCTIVSEDFLFESDNEYLTIRGESPHLGEVRDEFEWDKKDFIPEKLSETAQAYNALLFLDFIKALEENGVSKVKISFGYDKPLRLNTNLENVEIEYTLGSLIMGGEETEREVREESVSE